MTVTIMPSWICVGLCQSDEWGVLHLELPTFRCNTYFVKDDAMLVSDQDSSSSEQCRLHVKAMSKGINSISPSNTKAALLDTRRASKPGNVGTPMAIT